jgi:hypothetical protein
MLPPSSGLKNKSREQALSRQQTGLKAGFWLDLFVDPQDGGKIFL